MRKDILLWVFRANKRVTVKYKGIYFICLFISSYLEIRCSGKTPGVHRKAFVINTRIKATSIYHWENWYVEKEFTRTVICPQVCIELQGKEQKEYVHPFSYVSGSTQRFTNHQDKRAKSTVFKSSYCSLVQMRISSIVISDPVSNIMLNYKGLWIMCLYIGEIWKNVLYIPIPRQSFPSFSDHTVSPQANGWRRW